MKQQTNNLNGLLQRRTLIRLLLVSLFAFEFATITFAMDQDALESVSDAATSTSVQLAETVDIFSPSITDHDLDESFERAWETRPYRVAVWLCLDGSPELNAIYPRLVEEVTNASELVDPSGWDLAVGMAPSQWRFKFQQSIAQPAECQGFESLPMLEPYDKLIVVCLNSRYGQVHVRLREFDLQTRQWGTLLERETAQMSRIPASIMDAIKIAFMPLARIDRVVQKNNDDEVFVQVRAVDACYRTERNSDLQWEVVPIAGSPVFVNDDDRLLPVIRRTDRQGNLVKLAPIEFTFLAIEESDGSQLKCSVQSSQRAPLAGRKSKRAEKLALVIRPPQQSTRLILESRSEPTIPVEGLEILSRRPGANADEPSELLGKTDWRGAIEIPPTPEGLRLIYVSRGSRALRKLPIIPGFFQELKTTVANDETSLYAEGVILGLEKELLSLVIQRKILESDIAAALSDKQLDQAKTTFARYQALESPREIKNRMADSEVRLKTLTQDRRELEFISKRFDDLRLLLNSEVVKSQESALQEEIQKQSKQALSTS